MKPMFVEIHHREKDVRWLAFLAFAIAVIASAALLGGLASYLTVGRFGFAAPLAGGVLAFLWIVRKFLAIMAYQPIVIDEDVVSR